MILVAAIPASFEREISDEPRLRERKSSDNTVIASRKNGSEPPF
jgi:hypothetical protein